MSAKAIYIIGGSLIVGTVAWLLAREVDKQETALPAPEPTSPVPATTTAAPAAGAIATPIPVPAATPTPVPVPEPVGATTTPIPVPVPPTPVPEPTPPPVITPIPVPAPVPTYTPPALMADGNLPWELVSGNKVRFPFLPEPWKNMNVRDRNMFTLDFQPVLPPYGYYWPTWRAPQGPEGQRRSYFIIGVPGLPGTYASEDRLYFWAGDEATAGRVPKAPAVLLNEILTSSLASPGQPLGNKKFILDYNGNLIWGTL